MGRTKSEGVREEGARTICRPKGEEVRGYRRKLRKEELHGFCCASIIRMIKLRIIRLARHVACFESVSKAYKKFGKKTLKEETTWRKGGIGKVRFKCILRKRMLTSFVWISLWSRGRHFLTRS